MKSSLPIILFLPVTALLLSQCVVVDDTQGASSPAANVSGSPQESNQVYDMGLEKGFADGRGGLSRTPGRYAGSYPSRDSDAFSMGYEAGYNKGIR